MGESINSADFINNFNKNHRIILWLENNVSTEINELISKYCEIRYFSLEDEIKNTNFIVKEFYYNESISFYSDVVRYLLLYNYGGCWFDLDCFFLRSFDPIFKNYEKEICVYTWDYRIILMEPYLFHWNPKSDKMKNVINFIIDQGNGWGFQEANIHYDLPLDMVVLLVVGLMHHGYQTQIYHLTYFFVINR